MRYAVIAGATLYLGLSTAPCRAQLQPNAPWPSFGKDYQNSRTTTRGAPTNGSVRWIYDASSRTIGSPIVAADGTIYFGATDGVHAVFPDGRRRWRWSVGLSAATSTPAIDANGVVYIVVNPSDAILVALDGSTGGLIWSVYLGGRNVKSSPTIGPDGRIYVTNGEVPGGYLYCVNPDGTVAWRLYLGAEANSIPCFGTDGVIYVGSERHLNAVDPDGTFRWRFSVFYPIQGPVGIAGSRIFFSAWDGMVRAVNLSGQLLWQSPMGSILESGIAHTSNRVYVTSNIRELYAYNHFGSLQWVHSGNYRASTPAVGADGVIYAVGGVGSLVYALNPANGLVRWVTWISTANWYGSPAIGADGTVYVVNGNGALYAFGPLNGLLYGGSELDNWESDYADKAAVVQFYQYGELKYEMIAPLNPDGTFELRDTPIGVHDIRVRLHNSLFQRVSNVRLEAGQPATIRVNLTNGDVNRDNIVDDGDLLEILAHYGRYAPDYDLNGDVLVNDADLLIVLLNFGAVGE
jgi:outer membrane protein assembly factor BamB